MAMLVRGAQRSSCAAVVYLSKDSNIVVMTGSGNQGPMKRFAS
jgi:hypothetical protein